MFDEDKIIRNTRKFSIIFRKWVWNILVAIDQLINAITGGDPDETISSRCAKNIHKPQWKVIGVIVEIFDPGHLDKYIEHDEGSEAILDRDDDKYFENL